MLWFVLILLGVGSEASDASEPAPSRSYWTGRIEQDTTWRDTVYVGGDVTIAAAATLTLAPNTQVLFLPYRDDARGGLDTTRAELIVEGRLHAQAGGIIFRSADAGSLGADWYGLVVKRGGIADVSNVAIRDGLRCVYAKRDGRVTMDAIAFANCGKPTAPADRDSTLAAGGVELVDSLSVEAEPEDSYFLNDRAITRIPTKIGVGAMTTFATTVILSETIFKPEDNYTENNAILSKQGEALLFSFTFALLGGYPLGVYLADPVESSCWMTFVGGYSLAVGGVVAAKAGIGFSHRGRQTVMTVAILGGPIMASELSRLLPKRFRNPNPFKGLFGKFRRPSPHVSFGLVPDPQRGLSAVATLRF